MAKGSPSVLKACAFCERPHRVRAGEAKRRRAMFCSVKCYRDALNMFLTFLAKGYVKRDTATLQKAA
jgi:hypothetical protein